MKRLQVSVACLLLKLTFDPIAAAECEPCKEGQFVVENCTIREDGWSDGVRCRDCTNCTATNLGTLFKCSQYADSVCGNLTTAPSVEVSAPEWMVVSGIVLWLVALVLLTPCFVLLYRRRCPKNYDAGGLSHL